MIESSARSARAPTRGWSVRVGQLLVALVAIMAMTAVVAVTRSYVEVYAVHLCGWPATISCPGPSRLWFLVPMVLAVVAAHASASLIGCAWSGCQNPAAWLLVAWLVGFPVLVLGSRPRQFDGADLVLFGLYGGLAIALVRWVWVMWFPKRRRAIDIAGATVALMFFGILMALPSYLSAAGG